MTKGETSSSNIAGRKTINERLAAWLQLGVRPVAVIVASGGDQAVQVAKAATTTIPIVSTIAFDPVESGLVASMNRPGGNVTGIRPVFDRPCRQAHRVGFATWPQRLDRRVPGQSGRPSAKPTSKRPKPAARALGQSVVVVNVATLSDCEAAFDSLVSKGAARS